MGIPFLRLYHALDWINTRRTSSSLVVCPRYNIVSDSDYCVKLFATRSIKPVANKRMIARIYALLARVKQTNVVCISWTPSHTKANTPLANGNDAADLAARRCGAPCLSRSSSIGLISPPRPRSFKSSPPSLVFGLSPSASHSRQAGFSPPPLPRLIGDSPPSGVHSICDLPCVFVLPMPFTRPCVNTMRI